MAILKCTCEHKVQDELHGKNKRVMNPTLRDNPQTKADITYRCTVCLKERKKKK